MAFAIAEQGLQGSLKWNLDDDCSHDCNRKWGVIHPGLAFFKQGQTSARFRAISQHDTRYSVTYIYELCVREVKRQAQAKSSHVQRPGLQGKV